MHDLKPQCVVFIAKAPHVEGISFRSSDYTAGQVSNMASDAMKRFAGVDASGKMFVLGGIALWGGLVF